MLQGSSTNYCFTKTIHHTITGANYQYYKSSKERGPGRIIWNLWSTATATTATLWPDRHCHYTGGTACNLHRSSIRRVVDNSILQRNSQIILIKLKIHDLIVTNDSFFDALLFMFFCWPSNLSYCWGNDSHSMISKAQTTPFLQNTNGRTSAWSLNPLLQKIFWISAVVLVVAMISIIEIRLLVGMIVSFLVVMIKFIVINFIQPFLDVFIVVIIIAIVVEYSTSFSSYACSHECFWMVAFSPSHKRGGCGWLFPFQLVYFPFEFKFVTCSQFPMHSGIVE